MMRRWLPGRRPLFVKPSASRCASAFPDSLPRRRKVWSVLPSLPTERDCRRWKAGFVPFRVAMNSTFPARQPLREENCLKGFWQFTGWRGSLRMRQASGGQKIQRTQSPKRQLRERPRRKTIKSALLPEISAIPMSPWEPFIWWLWAQGAFRVKRAMQEKFTTFWKRSRKGGIHGRTCALRFMREAAESRRRPWAGRWLPGGLMQAGRSFKSWNLICGMQRPLREGVCR